MARLSEKSRSHVETVSDWPKGTYKRKFGYLHDQVWFPVSGNEYMQERPSPEYMVKHTIAGNTYYRLYLDRRMFWFKWFHIRLHTFYQGDDDSAVHDHPWWFITIPFTTYYETVEEQIPSPFPWYDWRQRRPGDHPTYWRRRIRRVRAFLPHFRRATHRHFVLKPEKPFHTIILTGPLKRDWGFWPKDNAFIPHREWATYDRDVKPGDRLT